MIPEFFDTAHHEIQRDIDFQAMEKTWVDTFVNTPNVTPVVPLADYCIPDHTWKNIKLVYSYNQTTRKIIDFYNKTDIDIIRTRRRDDSLFSALQAQASQTSDNPDLRVNLLFAVWNQMISLWPTPDSTLIGKQIRADVIKFLDPPAGNQSDWFTINARDWLVYRSLMECSPFLANDSRIPVWREKAETAWQKITGHDIESTWSGDLVMRG